MAYNYDMSKAEELVERLFGATLGSLDLLSVHLGWRLGLYDVLAEEGPLDVEAFASAAGIDVRYAREWLEQQAATGFVAHDDGTFSLPDEHREVFVDRESLSHVVPFAGLIAGIGAAMPEVVEAYRSGAGVPYANYGPDLRDGQGAINRPAYHHELASWVAAMPDVDSRLRSGGARIVDVGCGQGWSTIALARAYPSASVVGIDADEASVDDARANASRAGVDVEFRLADATAVEGNADLVCIFEALHDMARPVEALASARARLADGGSLLLADERVEDAFGAPAGEVERMMYGWSVLHCLPASRAEAPSAALGTVLRRPVVRQLAADAGFGSIDELEIENDFFRFYRLRA